MAEGLCRHFLGDRFACASAGLETHGLNPLAVRAMAEIGIDISGQASKSIDDLDGTPFDWVVTVCDHAAETCPVMPARCGLIHAGFDDPPQLARDAASEDEAMPHYRRVRDAIQAFIRRLPDILAEQAA